MSKNTNQKGFTLVELLIVIVVIAILAAISIVAYNGIQNRSKNTAAQSLASQVAKKAEAYNTINSRYPLTVAEFNATTESNLGQLTVITSGTPANENEALYVPCPASATATTVTGARITYRTFPTGTATPITVGTC